MAKKILIRRLTIADTTEFRDLGAAISGALDDVGLIKTADTGQIDWTTVSKPGTTSTMSGYEVRILNDTMHATAPIFLKISYGVWTNLNSFWIQISVGQGSDGSGNLTGNVIAARTIHVNSAQTVDRLRMSIFSRSEGFFGMLIGVHSKYDACFYVCRSCDSTGTPDGRSAVYHWGDGTVSGHNGRGGHIFSPSLALIPVETSISLSQLCINPLYSSIDNDIGPTAWRVFIPTPLPEPVVGVCGVRFDTFPTGMVFRAALVGSSVRTYITLNGESGPMTGAGTSGEDAVGVMAAMLWED
jgi:hypothetical protein